MGEDKLPPKVVKGIEEGRRKSDAGHLIVRFEIVLDTLKGAGGCPARKAGAREVEDEVEDADVDEDEDDDEDGKPPIYPIDLIDQSIVR